MNPDAERLATARRIIGTVEKRYKEYSFPCICPACNQPSIKSHSQQKEGQLRAIAKDGLVYALDRNFYHYLKGNECGDGFLDLHVLSIGEASTFPGYCTQHDQMIFYPIEKEPLVQNRHDQATLFMLRAISYEHACKRKALLCGNKLLKEVSASAPPEEYEFFQNWLSGVKLYLDRESPFYFQRIFNIICNSAYDQVKTLWVTVDHILPISTSTVFCPWMDAYEERWRLEKPQPLVSFTISPGDSVTHIVVSWLAEHDEDAAWIENKMQSTSGLEELINLCIAESEDCCFNIDFWDSLPNETRATVMRNLRHNSFRGSIQELPHIVTLT